MVVSVREDLIVACVVDLTLAPLVPPVTLTKRLMVWSGKLCESVNGWSMDFCPIFCLIAYAVDGTLGLRVSPQSGEN